MRLEMIFCDACDASIANIPENEEQLLEWIPRTFGGHRYDFSSAKCETAFRRGVESYAKAVELVKTQTAGAQSPLPNPVEYVAPAVTEVTQPTPTKGKGK